MTPITNNDQLEKAIAAEIVRCMNNLVKVENYNMDFVRGSIFAYKKVLDMLGKDVKLIAKIGGGVN